MKQLRISTFLSTSIALVAVAFFSSTASAQSGSRNVAPPQNFTPAPAVVPAQTIPSQNIAPAQSFAPTQTIVPSQSYVPRTYSYPSRVYRYPVRSYTIPRYNYGYRPLRNYRPFYGRRYFGGCGY